MPHTASIYPAVLVYPAVLATLIVAHSFGDIWVQTNRQARGKQAAGWAGRILCARHVASLTVTKAAALAVAATVAGFPLVWWAVALGLALDAVTHYIADRGHPLAKIAALLGKAEFWTRGDGAVAPTGTGAYALDQAAHLLCLWIATLIIVFPVR